MLRRSLWVLLFATLAFILYQWLTFPDVSDLAGEHPTMTAFMKRRQQQLRRAGKDDTIFYQWIPYSRISPFLRRAVLVSEDNEFYEHEGVDVEGLKEALRRDWEAKRFTHGGSTITQQLAKNLYLSPSRNPYRKFKEYLIARQLEKELSKKRILELYLNVVEMGERMYGAEAAARHYFGKSAAALSPREAALLAGSLPNPRVMNPAKPNRRLRARERIILARMRRWGHLAETQVLTPKSAPSPEASAPLSEAPVIDTAVPETETEEPVPTETVTPTETTTTKTTPPPPDTSTTGTPP